MSEELRRRQAALLEALDRPSARDAVLPAERLAVQREALNRKRHRTMWRRLPRFRLALGAQRFNNLIVDWIAVEGWGSAKAFVQWLSEQPLEPVEARVVLRLRQQPGPWTARQRTTAGVMRAAGWGEWMLIWYHRRQPRALHWVRPAGNPGPNPA
jgi:hypothetical protein